MPILHVLFHRLAPYCLCFFIQPQRQKNSRRSNRIKIDLPPMFLKWTNGKSPKGIRKPDIQRDSQGQMDQKKMKPCPFCKSTIEALPPSQWQGYSPEGDIYKLQVTTTEYPRYNYSTQVQCKKCFGAGPAKEIAAYRQEGGVETKRIARKLWNKRFS